MIHEIGEELPLSQALPAVLGRDFAGTDEAAGEGVAEFNVDDKIHCATNEVKYTLLIP